MVYSFDHLGRLASLYHSVYIGAWNLVYGLSTCEMKNVSKIWERNRMAYL